MLRIKELEEKWKCFVNRWDRLQKVGTLRNFKGFPKMKIKASKYKNGAIELWDALKGTIRMPEKKKNEKKQKNVCLK